MAHGVNGASRTTAWLLALMAGAGLVVGAVYPVSGPPPAPEDSARGRAIFLEHCSICHGAEGRGDGSSAWLMKPRPRDFTRGEFRLVSTMNGVPTDDDLYSVITHGFRGTAMMPWGDRLSAADRRLLVDVVKALWRAGRARAYRQAGLEPAEVERLVREDLTPGRPVSCRVDVDPTPASLARGRVVYERECGRCHGADGRGVSDPSLVNSRGDAAPSPDFTAGILKGGTSPDSIYIRLRAGMRGTPMPAFDAATLPQEDAWAVVHYIRSVFLPRVPER